MKLILNSFFVFILFSYSSAFGDVFFKEYIIYTSGIKIGKLGWEITIDDKNYSNNIKLESGGLLSALYSFEGNYFSSGNINNNILTAKKYTHKWETKKVNKTMRLFFNGNKLQSLEQSPVEKEDLRLNIYMINNVKDPLSSFLDIIFGSHTSLVVDGRRLYTMNAVYDEKLKQTIVDLTNYSNLWTDHKRSDFEKITFEKNNMSFLPSKMFIYFDGMIFKLK
jgi:hypothetical protein